LVVRFLADSGEDACRNPRTSYQSPLEIVVHCGGLGFCLLSFFFLLIPRLSEFRCAYYRSISRGTLECYPERVVFEQSECDSIILRARLEEAPSSFLFSLRTQSFGPYCFLTVLVVFFVNVRSANGAVLVDTAFFLCSESRRIR